MTKVIVDFCWDCGRMGDVEGLFVTTKETLQAALGKEVYFGEILGKHSEIYGTLEKDDVEILTDDQEFIEKFIEIMGDGTISGYNPLEYISYDDDDEDEEEE